MNVLVKLRALLGIDDGMQRNCVRKLSGLEVLEAVLEHPVLDVLGASHGRLVARELERGERRVESDDLDFGDALVNLEVRVAGSAAEVHDPRHVPDEEHVEREVAVERQITGHHEGFEDRGVRGGELVAK